MPHPLDYGASRGEGPRLHRGRPAAPPADPRRDPGGWRQNRRPGPRSPPTRCAYVGEAIAACIAPTRGEAEDLANSVEVEFEVLEAAVDAPQVWRGSRHLVHESWGDNLYLERTSRAATSRPPLALPR